MIGDARARFCGSCDRHVYNIVGLSRSEIESLVENTEGRLCVRMYQRADDTVLTQDCPVGLRALRKRAATFAGAALSTLLGLVSIGYGQDSRASSRSDVTVDRVKIDSGWSEISGFVTDLSGIVIPGVEVSLKGLGFEKHAKTDAEGRFRFESLRPDLRYELSLEREGFTKYKITNLDPANGEGLTVKVSMQPGSPPYAPVIEQERMPVFTEPTTLSSSISTRPIDPCADSGPKVERRKINSTRGTISGSITDLVGAVVPGIEIRLFQGKTLVAIVTSNPDGRFEMKEVKPAENYTLKLADTPWKRQIVEGIRLNAGEKVDYQICLEVSSVEEVVGFFFTVPPVEVHAEPTKPADTIVPRQTHRPPRVPGRPRP